MNLTGTYEHTLLPKRVCRILGCGADFYGKGFCRSHYCRAQRGTLDRPPEDGRGPDGRFRTNLSPTGRGGVSGKAA